MVRIFSGQKKKVAQAIVRERGAKKINTPVSWFELLNTLSRDINLASRNLSGTLSELLDSLVGPSIKIDAVSIWMVEGDTDMMFIKAQSGLSDRYVNFFNRTERIRVGHGMVGRVVSERKTVSVGNLSEYRSLPDQSVERWNVLLELEGIQAIMATPMYVGKKIIGSFNIYYKKEHVFSEEEKLFVETLSNQLAITIENSQNVAAIERNRDYLKNQIGSLLNMQTVLDYMNVHILASLDSSIDFLGDFLTKRFGIHSLALFERNSEGALALSASFNLSHDAREYLASLILHREKKSLISLAFDSKTVVSSERSITDERIDKKNRIFLSNEGLLGVGAFPLMVSTETTGVVAFYYKKPHIFETEETGILSTFAHFIGIHLKNGEIIESLYSEKQKTKSVLYSLSDGLVVFDLKGSVIEINPKAEYFLGILRQNCVQKQPDECGQNLSLIAEPFIADFETRVITIEEPRRRVFEVGEVPLRDEGGHKTGSLRVLHDITEQSELENLKSNFVSTASHQLRTPLTGIKWALEALRNERNLTAQEQRELLDKSISTLGSFTVMINDLLDVTKIEDNKQGHSFASVDILHSIENIITAVSDSAKNRGVTISFKPGSRPIPRIGADKLNIEIAIRNMLDNAIFYTLPGGTVEVGLNIGESSILITIKDTGIGIPKEDVKFIFQKFYRGKNAIRTKTEGSGLGLYIVKTIAERHGGRVLVESKENVGSTFTLQLPITQGA